jgi:hypothetical protein
MPVEIVNVTPERGDERPNEYEVRVNGEVLARFSHHRQDGLARCLFEATNAVCLAQNPPKRRGRALSDKAKEG